MGLGVGELGSNYACKGASSLELAGSTVSLPITYILICTCWRLGAAKGKFIHYDKVGYQFFGRTVGCLDVLLPEFEFSSAYFYFTCNTKEERPKKNMS